MSVCKGCGAPLEWIDTAAGRSMPVDPEPVFVIEGEGRDRFITDEGEVITHWKTCTAADSFRRK